jgi:hypothetical protein
VCPVNGKSGTCVPPCPNAFNQCSPVETCDMASGHCVGKACKGDADCPETSNIVYTCGASGTCTPKTCMSNADCPGHSCLNGICTGYLGTCVQPPG